MKQKQDGRHAAAILKFLDLLERKKAAKRAKKKEMKEKNEWMNEWMNARKKKARGSFLAGFFFLFWGFFSPNLIGIFILFLFFKMADFLFLVLSP